MDVTPPSSRPGDAFSVLRFLVAKISGDYFSKLQEKVRQSRHGTQYEFPSSGSCSDLQAPSASCGKGSISKRESLLRGDTDPDEQEEAGIQLDPNWEAFCTSLGGHDLSPLHPHGGR